MKSWGSHIALLSIVIILSVSGSVHAQDAGMSDVEIVNESDPVDDLPAVYAPGENVRYIPNAATRASEKDSIVLQIHDFPMQQATMRPAEDYADKEEAEEQKDDSILTFNFLYYIIQKYKLQDIID